MRPVYVISFSPLLVSLDVLFDLLETVHFIEYLDLFLPMGVDEPVYRERLPLHLLFRATP